MSSSYLTTTSPAWAPMWEALADVTGDYADCCPETGECWQYMGTDDGSHTFRHRNRPEHKNGRTTPPIKGFAGQHWGRVYLHLDAGTLQVKGLNVQPYILDPVPPKVKPSPPAKQPKPRQPVLFSGMKCFPGQDDLFATDGPPERTAPYPGENEDYGGAFDGFNVTSDADPGL